MVKGSKMLVVFNALDQTN